MSELASSSNAPGGTSAQPGETHRPEGEATRPEDEASRPRLDRLSIAAITVVSLAVAIFITLGLVELFGTERSDAVDVSDALEDSTRLDDPAPATLQIGSPVPEADLELLGGGTTSISDFRGKPLVVNFWSSTCAPCLQEMPDFESVHLDLDGAVGFLGVDVTDTPEAGRRMVEQTGVSYPNGRDPRAEVMAAFGGTALPRTVLVDPDGTVVALHSGALSAQELEDSLSESGLL